MHTAKLKSAACACLALLAGPGCAQLAARAEDWHTGRVEAVHAASAITVESALDCRAGLPLELLAGQRFVRVGYFARHALAHAEVPLPAGLVLAEGDRVSINLRDCGLPLRKLGS